jgi:hypothetical protein
MTHPADAKTDPLFLVDPREQKLPVWAQDIINAARMRVRDAERLAEAARLDSAPGDSPIVLDHRGPHGESQPVGLGERPWVKVVLERYSDGGIRRYIEVRAAYASNDATVLGAEVRGSNPLRIAPVACNDVKVYLEEW